MCVDICARGMLVQKRFTTEGPKVMNHGTVNEH